MARLTVLLLLGVLCALTATYEAKSLELKSLIHDLLKKHHGGEDGGPSSPRPPPSTTESSKKRMLVQKKSADDFFMSLMSELEDLGSGSSESYESGYGSGDYDISTDEEAEMNALQAFLEEKKVDVGCVLQAIAKPPNLDALMECNGVKGVVIHMMGYAIELMENLPMHIAHAVWSEVFRPKGILATIMSYNDDPDASGSGSGDASGSGSGQKRGHRGSNEDHSGDYSGDDSEEEECEDVWAADSCHSELYDVCEVSGLSQKNCRKTCGLCGSGSGQKRGHAGSNEEHSGDSSGDDSGDINYLEAIVNALGAIESGSGEDSEDVVNFLSANVEYATGAIEKPQNKRELMKGPGGPQNGPGHHGPGGGSDQGSGSGEECYCPTVEDAVTFILGHNPGEKIERPEGVCPLPKCPGLTEGIAAAFGSGSGSGEESSEDYETVLETSEEDGELVMRTESRRVEPEIHTTPRPVKVNEDGSDKDCEEDCFGFGNLYNENRRELQGDKRRVSSLLSALKRLSKRRG